MVESTPYRRQYVFTEGKLFLKYHVIVNGAKLRGKNARKLRAAEKIFSGAGLDYTVHRTERKDHESEITKAVTGGGGENCIIVMGGDGTLHKVLNSFENFENNCLALIPLGTGNDFAAAAGIPRNVKKAAKLIATKNAGFVDFIEFSNGLRSINAAGAGIDVDVLNRVYDRDGRKKSSYFRAFVKSLIKFESIDYTVNYDGNERTSHGLIALVGNGRQIGGGIKVCPAADVADGMLDVLIIDYISRIKLIGAFTMLMLGKLDKVKQVTAAKCKSVTFTFGGSRTVQADGELYDGLKFEARIVENKLKFIR